MLLISWVTLILVMLWEVQYFLTKSRTVGQA